MQGPGSENIVVHFLHHQGSFLLHQGSLYSLFIVSVSASQVPCSAIFRLRFRNIQVHVPQYSGPCSAIFRSMFRNIQVHVPQYSGPLSAIFRSMFRNIQFHVPQYSEVHVPHLLSTISKSAPLGEAFDFIIQGCFGLGKGVRGTVCQ
jgi:hypothetical protein